MLTEEERTCWMMDLLSPNITQVIKFNDDLLVIIEDCFKRVIQIDQHLALIREKESKEDEASDKQSSQGKKEKRSYLELGKATCRNNKKGQISQSGTNKPQRDNGPNI